MSHPGAAPDQSAYGAPQYAAPTHYAAPTQYVQPVAVPVVVDQETVGSWMLTLFLASLPIVGPIYVLILALGSGSSVAKKSWAIATIVWGLIALVTFVVLWLIFGTLLYTFVSESSQTLSS